MPAKQGRIGELSSFEHATALLSRQDINRRAFGHWEWPIAPARDAAGFLAEAQRLMAEASPDVRAIFEGLARARVLA